jgi:predicted O-methyltransferase YrrM
MISTLIPSYNSAPTLEAAVRSALGQVHTSAVIVVDDASTDPAMPRVLAQVQAIDARVRVVRLHTNIGPGGARNVALGLCNTPFVSFLDADDLHLEGFYAAALPLLAAHPQLASVRGHVAYADLPADLHFDWRDPRYPAAFNSTIWNGVYRRTAVSMLGGFPVDDAFRTRHGGEDIAFVRAMEGVFYQLQLPHIVVRHSAPESSHLVRWLRGDSDAKDAPTHQAWSQAFERYCQRAREESLSALLLDSDQPSPMVMAKPPQAPMSSMRFSNAWFEPHEANWRQWLAPMVGQAICGLELGCYEGRCSTWLLQNIVTHPNSRLVCVDTFAGSVEHSATQREDLAQRFAHNILASGQADRARVFCSTTERFLRKHPTLATFDFIYIDADHHAAAVLQDAVLAWPLLKPGGLLIFDDYLWADMPQEHQRPKLGVDAFLAAFGTRFALIHQGYQVAVRKLS